MLSFALLLLLNIASPAKALPTSVFSSIALYQGNWEVTPAQSGHGVDTISNQCYEYTKYFACQQTVNGKVGALVVYVFAGTPGHYKSQIILPDGKSLGAAGDLLIDGSHWTYSSNDTENGKTKYYRTTNDFHGHDQIQFEVAHSADSKTWIVDHRGVEHRVSTP